MIARRYLTYVPPPPPHPESVEVNRVSLQAERHVDTAVSPHRSRDDIVANWSCPVCEVSVPRRHRSGRPRVYCTNSCRQKAYRRRCLSRRTRSMESVTDPRPTRATTRDRVHAVREYRDVLSGRRDSTARGVTACGAFARISIDTPERFGHVRFLVDDRPGHTTTCRRCRQLTGATVTPPIVALLPEAASVPSTTPGGP